MTFQTIPENVAQTVELIQQRHPGEDGLEQVLEGMIKTISEMRAQRLAEDKARGLAPTQETGDEI